MSKADYEYLQLLHNILEKGEERPDRTGTGTIEIFGPSLHFNLREGFPLLTTKKLSLRIIAEELFWFLSGSTDLKWLLDRNVNIWNKDAYRFFKENNPNIKLTYEEFIEEARVVGFDLGNIYAYNLRRWEGVNGTTRDQVKELVEGIKENPHSRRHVITTWNPTVLDEIALPSCHGVAIQFHVSNNGRLSCQMTQRSSDSFLGLPFNIASYALLTHIIADMAGLEVGSLIINIGSAHIYKDHIEAVKEQLSREPRELPTLHINTSHNNIEDYTIDDIELVGYEPHNTIKANLSVGLVDEG